MRGAFLAAAVVLVVAAEVPAGEPEATAARMEAEAKRILAFKDINGDANANPPVPSKYTVMDTQQSVIATLRNLLIDAIAGQAISGEDAASVTADLNDAEYNLNGFPNPEMLYARECIQYAEENYYAGLLKQGEAVTAYNNGNYATAETKANEAKTAFLWASSWCTEPWDSCMSNSYTSSASADSLIP
jgi:hypothetical protein